MNYVIKYENGFYGKKPWSPVPLKEAVIFDSMKRARRMQNRLNSRLLKGPEGCGQTTILTFERAEHEDLMKIVSENMNNQDGVDAMNQILQNRDLALEDFIKGLTK